MLFTADDGNIGKTVREQKALRINSVYLILTGEWKTQYDENGKMERIEATE
jgi:hypothetical protein